MYWQSVILAPPPQGERILFYSVDYGHVYVGVTREGRWYDEAEYVEGAGAEEVGEVTHWMPIPKPPRPRAR